MTALRCVVFDLDDTLLNGDSNHVWGRFLVERGVLDGPRYQREQSRFDRDYHAGTIDFSTYLSFTLSPLRGREPHELRQWQDEFARNHAAGAIFPQGLELVESHPMKRNRPAKTIREARKRVSGVLLCAFMAFTSVFISSGWVISVL